jgi:hypothetical protein
MSDISFSESYFYLIFFIIGSIGILMMGLLFIVLEVQSRRHLREIQMQSLDQARTGPPPVIMARTVSPEEITVTADTPSPGPTRS